MKLYIVWEDNHGDVSWWTEKHLAIREMRRIIKYGWCKRERAQIIKEYREENPKKRFRWWEAFSDCVGYREVELNKSWN